MLAITEAGGLSLVQRPEETAFGTMPARAIRKDHVDRALGIEAMAEALSVLAEGPPFGAGVSDPLRR